MIVTYRTVRSNDKVLSLELMEQIGQEGWHLGGVTQTTEAVSGFGFGDNIRRNVYHYHFWKERNFGKDVR